MEREGERGREAGRDSLGKCLFMMERPGQSGMSMPQRKREKERTGGGGVVRGQGVLCARGGSRICDAIVHVPRV